jgi:hypothetical protein
MPHRIKQQVRTAIDTPELRRAIRIMDNIHEAMELLTQISPPVLEALRDAFKAPVAISESGRSPGAVERLLSGTSRPIGDKTARTPERELAGSGGGFRPPPQRDLFGDFLRRCERSSSRAWFVTCADGQRQSQPTTQQAAKDAWGEEASRALDVVV